MTLILKQSTAIDIRVGPFVDATDGVTPETGITLGAADQAEVLKANGAATVAMAGTFAAVTGSDGWYDYTVATGDVDTVGEVVFVVQDSSVSLPVFVRGQVLEETVYDQLYASGATGSSFTDDGKIASGTAQSATSTTLVLASGETFANDEINGATVVITSATTGTGQSRIITDYVSSTDTATVDTWTTTPTGATITYSVYATPPSSATSPVEANVTQIAGDATSATNLAASTLGIAAGAAIAGTLSSTQMTTDLTEATDNHYIDGLIVWTSGVLAGSRATITDYVGSTKLLTYSTTPSAESPSATDTFVIV